jgi:hypothetical protein
MPLQSVLQSFVMPSKSGELVIPPSSVDVRLIGRQDTSMNLRILELAPEGGHLTVLVAVPPPELRAI